MRRWMAKKGMQLVIGVFSCRLAMRIRLMHADSVSLLGWRLKNQAG
jgi:hypothetical protein